MLTNDELNKRIVSKIKQVKKWFDRKSYTIIFWLCFSGLILFIILPYLWGWFSIFKTIF